jgi:hypothetical protein
VGHVAVSNTFYSNPITSVQVSKNQLFVSVVESFEQRKFFAPSGRSYNPSPRMGIYSDCPIDKRHGFLYLKTLHQRRLVLMSFATSRGGLSIAFGL